ncbi:hypothetical protein HNY73_015786 [Argiope bruennichi]|uniref:Uncharacterized protein n=1 Tax=Argiope bruennichi TaxID=94029 RepID=A0A8T0EHM6_ARGBR|nr:hypothetical protein HNY73_015786 [Argiope bruennichi]
MKTLNEKRIWPLDDELGVPPDEVVVREEEEGGGALRPFRLLPSLLDHPAQLRLILAITRPAGRLGLQSPQPVDGKENDKLL